MRKDSASDSNTSIVYHTLHGYRNIYKTRTSKNLRLNDFIPLYIQTINLISWIIEFDMFHPFLTKNNIHMFCNACVDTQYDEGPNQMAWS